VDVINWNSDNSGYVEASDLIGLPPGTFPQVVEVDGLRLVRSGVIIQAGEVLAVNYFTEDFRYVMVFND